MFTCHSRPLAPSLFSPLFRVALPQSEKQFPLLGLHLLFLLAHNRIAEFHTELHGLPEAFAENAYIRWARELEQFYMEGSYQRVLAAASKIPAPYYAPFMTILATTVRYGLDWFRPCVIVLICRVTQHAEAIFYYYVLYLRI
jgi:hypothetical protein